MNKNGVYCLHYDTLESNPKNVIGISYIVAYPIFEYISYTEFPNSELFTVSWSKLSTLCNKTPA